MPLTQQALRELVFPAVARIAGGAAPTLVTLPGGASLRKYHRVTIPGGTPERLVVMELAEDRAASEEASKAQLLSVTLESSAAIALLHRGPRLTRLAGPRPRRRWHRRGGLGL